MIKYIVVSATKNVSLKDSTAEIAVLCGDSDKSGWYWRDSRTKDKLLMFDNRNDADAFIVRNSLTGAFSYGIDR